MTSNLRETTPEPIHNFSIPYKPGEDAPDTLFPMKTHVVMPDTPVNSKPSTSSVEVNALAVPVVFKCAACGRYRPACAYEMHDSQGNYYCNICD